MYFYGSLCSAPLYLLSNYCDSDSQWSNLRLDETRNVHSAFYSTWLLKSLPFFLTPFSLVQKMSLCVFFFSTVPQRISFPLSFGAKLLSCDLCFQSVFTLYSTHKPLVPPHFLQKREKNPAMPNILERDRTFPESFKRKMQKGSYFLLPTHQQFAPDFFSPGDLKVPSGIASSSLPYAPAPRVYTWPLLRFFLWGFC